MSSEQPERRSEANITRRQMLARFGMIGGSSLMLTTMRAWDLIGQPAGPRPVISGDRANARVVILGAGVSGLATALELTKRGYDVTVLEARDRVGGLNWTITRGTEHTELGEGGERQVCQFDEGMYLNAGPWRIPHDHHAVLGYAKELGVRMEQFIDDNVVMYNENPALGPLANKKVYLREIVSDMWGHTTELLAKAANQGAIDEALSADDKERLVQFLVRAGYLNNADQVYTPNARVRGNEDQYDLSTLLASPFANQVRSINSGTGGPDPVFQPTGGMMQIAIGFHRALGDIVQLGSPVESVTQTADNVRVVYRDGRGGGRTEVTADYVVSCLPLAVLKTLEINLSPEMKVAVDASSHSTSSKMGLQMKRRFWEEDDGIYGGHLTYTPYDPSAAQGAGGGGGGFGGGAGNPLPSFSYPSNDYHSPKGVLLGYYGNGTMVGIDGKPLIDVPVARRIEHVLSHASKVHPQIRDEYESAYAVWWPRVEYSLGAYAGNPGNRLEQLSKPDGRIYVGSAGVSSDPAWIEGAISSAWRTVEALHSRVMG